MAKRPNTPSPKFTRKQILAAKLATILQRLEATYALGKEALVESEFHRIRPHEVEPAINGKAKPKKRPKPYARHVIVRLAKKYAVHFNTVETARRIAKCYNEKQFRQLIRRRTPNGLPLTSNHLTHLSSVGAPKLRAKFEDLAISQGWSARELVAAIQAEKIKRGQSKRSLGDKPLIPTELSGIVQQIQRYCDQWLRWSRTFEAEIEARDNLGPKLKGITKRLASLEREVKTLHEKAGRLLVRGQNIGSSRRSGAASTGRSRRKLRASGAADARKTVHLTQACADVTHYAGCGCAAGFWEAWRRCPKDENKVPLTAKAARGRAHRRPGYPLPGWFPPEPGSVSPDDGKHTTND